jgi:hypothetical protein
MTVLTTGSNRVEIIPRPADVSYTFTGVRAVRVVLTTDKPSNPRKGNDTSGRTGR